MDNEQKLREYLRRVTLELHKARAQLDQRTVAADSGASTAEPLAIVGMACRFPGGADSPDALWRLLSEERDAIGEFPRDRGWDLDALYDPDPEAKGKSSVCQGGFLDDVAGFDAAFFGISPREALTVDPQQRLLLELSWEALERAGLDPEALQDSATGVFVGLASDGYVNLAASLGDEVEGYVGLGSACSVASGRIAYTLGLQGPAVAIDTACSSSLVALHLACQALRARECDMALAGGVTVLVTPALFIEFSRQRGLAPDGRCKPFSERADGTSWSEGAGMLALTRLADAQAQGRKIWALVRGSAVNQDGRSQGLTAPNGPAQQSVIKQALASAQLTAAEVALIEAHGTGTTLGDPIEAEALIATYGQEHSAQQPVWLGSLKSNIGHTQAAAGVAGVIKLALALERERMPRSLFAQEPSRHVDWASGGLRLLQDAQPWPRGATPRRAAVSSFGVSGTNAHVVLEEAPAEPASLAEPAARDASWPLPFVISAKSMPALRAQLARLREHLLDRPELSLLDVAHSLLATRTQFDVRAALVATDRDQLLPALQALARGEATPLGSVGRVRPAGKRVFVFPGQGSQWLGMARELMASAPVFAEQMQACAQALAPYLDVDVLVALQAADEAMLERVDVVQPLLFAVMVSLAALWRAQGIEPDAVLGHSQGEIAAAYVAGALSLSDAARVVSLRARALTRIRGRGGMAALELSAEQTAARLVRYADKLAIAAVNGPQATVVAGDAPALDELLQELAAEQILARRVRVDYASHCAQLEPIQAELLAALADLAPQPAALPFYSALHARLVPGEALDAQYWYDNGRNSVRFSAAVGCALADGHACFIEMSPHPVLTQAVLTTAEAQGFEACALGSLRRDQGGLARVLLSIAELHVHGQPVELTPWLQGGRPVELPTYAFARERYWPENVGHGRAADAPSLGLTASEHPLLAASVALAEGDGVLLTGRISLATHAWLAGHVVFEQAILPGTAFAELALTAAHHVGMNTLEELTLEAPLVLPERGHVQLQVFVGANESAGRSITIHARSSEASDESWTRHASGRLTAQAASLPADESLRVWPPAGAEPIALEELYPGLARAGLKYAGPFCSLREAYRAGDALYLRVELPADEAAQAARYNLHPALLDAALHGISLRPSEGAVGLPFAWSGLQLQAAGARALRVRMTGAGPEAVALSITDDAGEPLARVEALRTRRASADDLQQAHGPQLLHRVEWVAVPRVDASLPGLAVLGESDAELLAAWPGARAYASLPALIAALDADAPLPEVVVARVGGAGPGADVPSAAYAAAERGLELLQDWAREERLAGVRLLLLSAGALAVHDSDRVPGLAQAPVWGLARTLQSERPDLSITLLDVQQAGVDGQSLAGALAAAISCDEPQLALRGGQLHAPRLLAMRDALQLPAADADWSLQVGQPGTFEGLTLRAQPSTALLPQQVRLAVHAAGLNFRDVLTALGMYPGDPGPIGLEGAGVVLEVGSDVQGLRPGDRVFGLFSRAFGPRALADARLLAPIPDGLSFEEAASTANTFLTSYYGLVDVGALQPGERVLIHAAAGGVGMAAVQVARALGAEVFATASPSKWSSLRALGLDDAHLASSRDGAFEERFRAGSAGQGMDVVLNSLAHALTDASLRLTRPGGRFVEMGKTDLRDPAEVARTHAGVAYRAFDLSQAPIERLQALLQELCGWLARGAVRPLPVTTFEVGQAREAFRHMAQARHIGKIVLRLPQPLPAAGSVLITGGTGMLGALVAEHLVRRHGVRHLILCSRTGSAPALEQQLTAAGAQVRVAACDVASRPELAALLGSIPPEHPLCAVIHCAGALDDGAFETQTPARLASVFAPKLDAAWHLHELTRDLGLSQFVLFSSAAGVLGNAGQANYAAANTFLDALAQQRRAQGLQGLSLAWGYWSTQSAMTSHLADAQLERMRRGGVRGIEPAEGLVAFDAALFGAPALCVPVRLEQRLLEQAEQLPALLRGLVRRQRLRRAGAATGEGRALRARLAALPAPERARALLELVAGAIREVLGLSGAALEAERPLRELGLDSLMAVELRNRLSSECGMRLPATLLFDHPTALALCRYLDAQLMQRGATEPQRLPAARRAGEGEPIAVVAMSCRFPGGIDTPEALWELLVRAEHVIGDFPIERGWDIERLYDPDPDAIGKCSACKGGFLTGSADFDPAFFGISPREALAMDPQQRLLLETAWEALERAGLDPHTLQASATGVFVGLWQSQYALLPLPAELSGHLATGNSPSVASGRIAYHLGLQGPALTVDTACSSSLVAIHLACQALREGECDLALAGGATVMATPDVFLEFSRQRGLARDGLCKPFSDAADGTGFSDGVAMLLLERVSDAQRAGHPVLAVLRGSAINQDGKSQGLTAPNGPAQEEVIRRALAAAQLTAADVDAVEAHGTGTTLGDPIEAQAVLATYGAARASERPLWLGSVKSNLGHTQAAAGAAGLMKMILALQHGMLPRSLHAESPSRHVDWSSGCVALLAQAQPWPADGRPRRAGVSSFGFSGTNAHVIVEEAPCAPVPEANAGTLEPAWLPFVLSARSREALRAQAARLHAHVSTHPELSLRDLAYSLVATRSAFEMRAVIVAQTRDELLLRLQALADGQAAPLSATGRVGRSGPLALLFTGQGGQRAGAGRELYARYPAFREAFDAACAALGDFEPPLREVMFAEPGSPLAERLNETLYVQPALFALEVALTRLLESFGVHARYLLGHSLGEIVAAHVAEVLSLADAGQLVAARARLMQALPEGGAMAALELSQGELGPLLNGSAERVSLAAINGPRSLVVAGDDADVLQLMAACERESRKAKRLLVNRAFHCQRVEPMLEALSRVVAGLDARPAQRHVASNLTGELAAPELLCEPGYWTEHARRPVLFHPALQALARAGVTAYLEVGPQPVLSSLVHASGAADAVVASSLRTQYGEEASLLLALAELYVHGQECDFRRFFEALGARKVALPTYAFARERFWPALGEAAREHADVTSAGLAAAEHPLLGACVTLGDGAGLLLTGRLSLQTQPWLRGHEVLGHVILPGTAFVELCLVAAQKVGLGRVDELTLEAPLPLPDRGGVQLQVVVAAADASGARALHVYARREDAGPDAEWVRHASATLTAAETGSAQSASVWPPHAAAPRALEGLYEGLAEAGLRYGGPFQAISAVWTRPGELFAELQLPEAARAEAGQYIIHPALLDAAAQLLTLREGNSGFALPFAFEGVQLQAAGASRLRVRLHTEDPERPSLALFDELGQWLGGVAGIQLRAASSAQLEAAQARAEAAFALAWQEVPAAEPGQPLAAWVALGETPTWARPAARHADVAALLAALPTAAEPPAQLVTWAPRAAGSETDAARAAQSGCARLLGELQAYQAEERLGASRLFVVTSGAVAVSDRDRALDPAHTALWGLVRTLQGERPELELVLLDLEPGAPAPEHWETLLAAVVSCGEPQLALRAGKLHAPRLLRSREELALPAADLQAEWSLQVTEPGTFEGLTIVDQAAAPLAPHEARVAVHAAGLNFRDVMTALGMYPGEPGPIGLEGAGVVLEVGAEVDWLRPGERVLGLLTRAFGPRAVTDARLLAPMPRCLSYAQAASVPTTFLTAYYGLVDLGRLRPGERVLVHAAAGGVGMAAVQLAQHLGAEVFATASPGKWQSLRELGLDDAHIASSRDLEFEARFREASGGHGMDVVLDSLAHEPVDASLRLTRRGGRFLEMGKTDIRDPARVAEQYPGVEYRAFDLVEAGAPRMQALLREVCALIGRCALRALPVSTWELARARQAFRHMAQARHTGKIVLTLPQPLPEAGTVLITGGTGTLGGLLARHLVERHGVRRLILCSRSGGGEALVAQLQAAGAAVQVAVCDVADREQLRALLAGIPAQHPLSAVFHTAGVVDDAMFGAQSPERLARVFAPKLTGAWNLHELTRQAPLAAFVLFSSVGGVLGAPGQANYAAANAFLDGLAQLRRAQGLPALALDWGLWAERSGVTSHLTAADLERMARGGMLPLATEDALQLLDRALGSADAQRVPVRMDARLFSAPAERLPHLLRALGRRTLRSASKLVQDGGLRAQVSALPESERERALLEAVTRLIGTVLGSSAAGIEPDRPVSELGLDSLMAVELRNHLAQLCELRLPSTLLFDRPTPLALARYLNEKLFGAAAPTSLTAADELLVQKLRSIPIARLRTAGLLEVLLRLADGQDDMAVVDNGQAELEDVDSMSADELVRLVQEDVAEREEHAI